jgi:hypothetical protein
MPTNGHNDPRTYSLPRVNGGGNTGGYTTSPMANPHGPPVPAYHSGYSSYDRRLPQGGYGQHPAGGGGGGGGGQRHDVAPDHYFMPSQRKYSGEFVRVYVDYNK